MRDRGPVLRGCLIPSYNASPVAPPPELLLPGVPGYAFGSKATGPTTLLQITQVALTSNVATVTVLVREGNIPTTSGLITITGTSVASGSFNVTNKAITGVSITAATGVGTITFALVHADVAPTADAGQGLVPVPEIGEALTNVSSVPFAIPEGSGHDTNELTITWSTFFPSAPGAVTMTLQAAMINLEAAMINLDAQYVTLDSSTATTTDLRSITLTRFRFLRVTASGVSGGTNPTSVVKILI